MNQSIINKGNIDLLDNLAAGIVVLDQDGGVNYANSAAMKVLDIDLYDLIESSFLDVINDEKMTFALESLNSGITEKTVFEIARNNKFVKVSTQSLDTGRFGIGAVMISLEDLTKFHELDKIKTDFVSTLLHRLRTPLTTLKSSLSFLSGNTLPGMLKEVTEIISMCHSETDRLVFFLNDLRDLFLIESGIVDQTMDRNLVPVSPVIQRAVRSVRHHADDKSIEIEFNDNESSAIIEGDEERLYQVIGNILVNAITFTPKGGKVTLNIADEIDNLRISIMDTGIGVSEEELKHLFEKHYRADNEITREVIGYGLGLYITNFFVEFMGGKIYAYSELGHGSQFDLVFPR